MHQGVALKLANCESGHGRAEVDLSCEMKRDLITYRYFVEHFFSFFLKLCDYNVKNTRYCLIISTSCHTHTPAQLSVSHYLLLS